MTHKYQHTHWKKSFVLLLAAAFVFLLAPRTANAQLVVNPGVTSAQLISALAGNGLTVSNVQLNCAPNAYGTFSNGNTTNVGITNGILLTTGNANVAIGPNNSSSAGFCNGTSSADPQLTAIEPQASEDLCVLEFDIVPQCNTLTITFVFGSEEYPEFVNSSFNDAFGFFISGPGPACQANFYNNTNVATLPNGTPVSIDNVNATTNNGFYVNNAGGTTIQYDAFTTVLTRNVQLCPCQSYHFKLAIADAGDCSYDSGVFVDFMSCSNALVLNTTSTNSGCSGCTGTAGVTVTGGTGPFSYTWAPGGQTTANVTGLCPGTYTVSVSDNLSCSPTSTAVVTIGSTGSAITTTGAQTNILCNGQCTGSATVTVTGGTGPFTYSWAPSGGTGASASGLCAGTYTVTVTGAGGCQTTRTFTITQPPALTATQGQTNVLCNGQCTGSATVTPSGGTAPYTYSWAPSGGTAATTTGRCAGTYTCTITDANGCTITRTFNITQPPALSTTGGQTNVLCNGQCTGSATVTPSGGTAPYTYSWAPSGGTAATTTGRCAGTYTVTVTDANGCTTTRTFNITQPPALTATQGQTNVLCNGQCTGSATVTPSGGTAPYTYSWAPSGGTAATTTGRCAGTYTVTITDANGCTITRSFNITQPPAITTTGGQTNVLCNGQCTGSATVTPSGGTAPYTYSWAPSGGTAATTTGRCAGTYTVTVTDANGCTATRTFNITQPPALTTTGGQTNVLCNGQCTGSATVTPSGGTAPYTYSWAPSGGTGSSATALCAGTYTATVTDANGCTTTRTFSITQPPALTATQGQTNILCNGQCTGSATVTPSGGTAPYTYSWAPSGGTAATTTGRCAGTYTCTITDANGCTITRTFNITQPPAMTTTGGQTNVLCNGQCTGSATVTPSGGTAPYTYSWAPSGGTAATTTGRCAGTYTVTVTDANGCTATRTFNITQPPALTTTGGQTNVLCNGQCTGSATVTPSGGTAPYTYSWAPSGGTAATTTGRCAGTYTVTVTDANGCTATRTFNITQPPALSGSTTVTPATCGGNNGSATVTASGGVGPYTYSWAPSGGTGTTASSLGAGTYTVTITDANGCTTTATAAVPSTGGITASISASTNVSCFGGNNGTATATPTGGAAPYTYAWTPSGGTGATGTNLTAGSYTVTVTDANGCVATASVTITQPTQVTASASSTPVACNGGSNGGASVTASGGVGPYTYSWAPSGGTGSSASGLTAGGYTVTVTDANGCTTTASTTVTQPTALATTGGQTNVLCNGQCTGSATVTASGGTSPYTYSWAPSGGTAASASALCAGGYTVTVTDANGCTITRTFNITQPPALSGSTAATAATCGQPNGSATVTPTGGTAPYTYSWAPSGGTGSSASGLISGGYTVTITDANGCTTTATVNVPNTGGPTASITASTNVSCFGGNNGSATATPSGGTGPYTYSWSPSGGTGATGTNLTAGSYTVTVTDANGCVTTASITITEPPLLTASASSSPVSCNGGNDGGASVTASGGVGPYGYSWAPSGGTGASASGLTAGGYTVTVTDANGCTATASATVTQPTAVTATITASTPVSCFGGNNGSATVSAAGGIGPYTYNWAPSGGTGATAGGLTAGGYTVTVTDANGCTTTASVNITEPTALGGTTAVAAATCGQANGSATVTPTGGIAPYTYVWSSGGTAATETGLLPNTYTVTITDANNCTFTVTATVPNAGGPTATISTSTNVSCFGGNDGSATVSVSNGTAPFTYSWAPSGGTGTTASGLTATSYTVTVTDANGCVATATVTITEPPLLTASAASTPVSCFGGNDGTTSSTVNGGVGPYTYAWAPSGGTGSGATGLTANSYTVTVTDANGCTTTASTIVTEPTALTASITASTPVSCFGGNNGSATVAASGGVGPYTYAWAPNGGTGTTASSLIAGAYTVTVTDANGCTTTASVNITEPPALGGTTTVTSATCGQSNGSATVTPSGGVAPYSYLWSSGGTNATENGLAQNTYTVTITDANSCTFTVTATVPNAGGPTATLTSSTDVTCFGANDGTASVNVTGGTGTITYTWTPSGGSTANATGLGPNTYTCTVSDANGCLSVVTVTITEPPALQITNTAQTDVLCFGGNNGDASVTVTGGTGAYTYAWAPSGGTGSSATGLTAGGYTCTITDANGCSIQQTFTITEPPQLTVAVAGFDATCFGACDGQVVVIPNGGVQPYSFLWNTGCTSPSCNNICAGTYTITVTDANGCTATGTATVNDPPQITTAMSSTPANCNQPDGSVTVVAGGGTGSYSYLWNPGSLSGSTGTSLIPGNYTVTVTDGNGCTAIDSVVVANAPGVNIQLTASSNATCNGVCDGSATISASGGTGPYTISWTSGGNALTESNLCAGTYTVTVTDANGCSATLTVTITEPQPIQLAVSSPPVICIGQNTTLSTTINGGTPPYTEVWSPNGPNVSPTVTTTYTVNVTDANGCTVPAQTVTVTVNPALAVVASPNVSICPGSSTQLSATGSGGDGNYTYTWTPAPGAGNPVNVTPGTTTIYTVTITDGCGTPAATSTVSVTVQTPPQITFTADQQSGCMPLCVSFTDQTVGAVSCAWDFGDGVTDNTTCTPIHCYATPGAYDVSLTVTDANGCISTVVMPGYINVYPLPVADFSFGPQPTTILNPEISFTDQSIGASAWSWSFGDLLNSSSNLQNPTFSYPDTGCHVVTLTVTNIYGCTSDTTYPVCIDGDFVIFVPNAFTPNDDGNNDLFFPQGMGIDPDNFEMWIFDRWGNMIFYTDDLYKGWNGKANQGEEIAQIDTYVWKISVKDYLGNKHNYIGKVSLIK